MEFASRIDGRIVPGRALRSSTRQADHHRAIKASPRADEVLATAAGSPAGNPSGCTVPISALRTTRITTRFLVAQAPAGPINPGVSDTVEALGTDANMQIDIEQVLKTVRARLKVMMQMRIIKCKEPKRCPEDFGKPLDERIRGMSTSVLSDLCDRGTVFDQECCKAAALGISRNKKVESAQVGLPARFPLSAPCAPHTNSHARPSAPRAQRFLDALPRPQAEPEPYDVEEVLDMWRCVREDEPMLEHTEGLPEMGKQSDALVSREKLETAPGLAPNSALGSALGTAPNSGVPVDVSGVMASVMAGVTELKMPDTALKMLSLQVMSPDVALMSPDEP